MTKAHVSPFGMPAPRFPARRTDQQQLLCEFPKAPRPRTSHQVLRIPFSTESPLKWWLGKEVLEDCQWLTPREESLKISFGVIRKRSWEASEKMRRRRAPSLSDVAIQHDHRRWCTSPEYLSTRGVSGGDLLIELSREPSFHCPLSSTAKGGALIGWGSPEVRNYVSGTTRWSEESASRYSQWEGSPCDRLLFRDGLDQESAFA